MAESRSADVGEVRGHVPPRQSPARPGASWDLYRSAPEGHMWRGSPAVTQEPRVDQATRVLLSSGGLPLVDVGSVLPALMVALFKGLDDVAIH